MTHGTHLRQFTGTRITVLIIVTFISVSCSVKEMREACPCRVGLDFSKLLPQAASGGEILATVSAENGKILYRRDFGTDTCSPRYEILLPKGVYTASALLSSGEAVWIEEDDGIRLQAGSQADSLYGQATLLDARGEEAEYVPQPLKQFATLFILFGSPVRDLGVEVALPASFIAASDLSAVASPFSVKSTFSGVSGSVRLPRQTGGNIFVTFYEEDGNSPIARVDLEPMLRRIGYDFNAPELADIFLTMDFAAGQATIEVEGWKESFIIVTF